MWGAVRFRILKMFILTSPLPQGEEPLTNGDKSRVKCFRSEKTLASYNRLRERATFNEQFWSIRDPS